MDCFDGLERLKMRIAICDDDKIFAISLQNLLVEIGCELEKIEYFKGGEELLLSMEKSSRLFDLIFLDIEMEKKDGLTVAKEIRQTNQWVEIVIVTNYLSYWQEGYTIKALQYLVKPIEKEALSPLIKEVRKKAERASNDTLFISSKGIQVRIPLDEILYFDIYKERITAFTSRQKVYEFYSTMFLLEKELKPKGFFRIHKSLLVNLNYFYKRKDYDLFLTDGTVLPISRNRINAFKEALMNYHGGDTMF